MKIYFAILNKSEIMRIALLAVIIIDSIGGSIGILLPLYYIYNHRTFPVVMGIKLLGGGAFEKLGIETVILAGIIFSVISVLKLLSAFWLWNFRLDGAVLELILLGISAIFWYGFELPFGPLLGLTQIVLILLTWNTLN
jgi:hypothetical protein